ncbi:MAG: pantoate--beta-alanine ligase [Verrucomicrobia bacterium]|nr:pantoate--beta-alanine ligase [Verrucomicrobiota bacterium]
MQVVSTGSALRDILLGDEQYAGRRVLVPTMGALHRGHLALVKHAREVAGPDGVVVVSIFVNPIQFDREDDLEAYPRPLETDLMQCQAAGVDVVFVPDVREMYAHDRSTLVTENSLSRSLCGAARPGHFDGVCTVVLKLFMLSACHAAVFGEKDFQQLAIIRRMVRDLDVPVEIVESPTIRESDGLALSSRNVRLSATHREDAPCIFRALNEAAKLHNAEGIIRHAMKRLGESEHLKIDYLTLVDAETLQPINDLKRPSILAAAVFYDNVRLIDHVRISPP